MVSDNKGIIIIEQDGQEHVLSCPACSGIRFTRNGRTWKKRPNYRCRQCGRQVSVLRPGLPPVEKIVASLAAASVKNSVIARALDIPAGRVRRILNG